MTTLSPAEIAASLTDSMETCMRQIEQYGEYWRHLPSCYALVRRGVLVYDGNLPLGKSYVFTDLGRAVIEEMKKKRRMI